MNSPLTQQTAERIITTNDIVSLLSQFNIATKDPLKVANEIFTELSNPQSLNDFIPLSTLLEQIITNKALILNSKNKHFYIAAIQFFLTPSEQIKDILHKAKKNLTSSQTSKSVSRSIDWAISTLCRNDIFDLKILKDGEEPNCEYVKFLSLYSYDKLKNQQLHDIKSVAEIRDKRRSSLSFQLPKEISLVSHFVETLKTIDDFDFNVFEFKNKMVTSNLKENTNSKIMFMISNYIFEEWDLYDNLIQKDKMKPFIKEVCSKYKNNPYHNSTHAIDVLQTTHMILKKGEFKDREVFDDLDIASMLISSIIHDIGHPGLSNTYLINKQAKIALKYNDKSPLENMHCYKGFKILAKEEFNILGKLSMEEKRIIRKRSIEAILNTDGANHSRVLNAIKTKIEIQSSNPDDLLHNLIYDSDKNNKIAVFDAQQSLINLIIHASDISNPAKKFDGIYDEWTRRVMEEFFNEGDLEKKEGLPVNFLCDREKTYIPKAQIGFIVSIVLPTFKMVEMFAPEIQPYLDNLANNERIWKQKIAEDEKGKKANTL